MVATEEFFTSGIVVAILGSPAKSKFALARIVAILSATSLNLIQTQARKVKSHGAADIRFKRMNDEYQSVRNAQDELFEKVDTFEEALLGLTEIVAENSRKLDAINEHLQVPYKPPAAFVKD